MSKYIMMGRYSAEAIQGISAERTDLAKKTVKKFGGELQAAYAILGNRDLLFVTDFPTVKDAMKASLALSKTTGISFSTAPALDVQEFDKLAQEI